jgi:aryl-alcohol dehydrogenase-like predicted oxidoreductase
MRTRRLGNSELTLTTIGLGTWAQGGSGWKAAWGPQDDRDSVEAIKQALNAGINWIDTAAVYGLGHAEEVVGQALKQIPKSEWPIIATKCGRDWNEQGELWGNLKADRIRKEIDDSLRRLGVEVIDLYQIHWPQPDEDIEEAWGVMADLVRQGKIRYPGVSNFDVAQMERISSIHPVASLQPPYSMLRRDVETEILPYCGKNDIGVVAYSPMQKGLLTGKYTKERVESLPEDDHRTRDKDFHGKRFEVTARMVAGLGEIAGDHGKTTAQLALAWVLRRPEVTSAIAGARSGRQIKETAEAGDWELSGDIVDAVEELLQKRERELPD